MKIFLTIITVIALSGCAYTQNLGNALIGISQAQQVDSVRADLLEYLPDEQEAEIASDLAFFDAAYQKAKEVGFDSSLVTLVLESPEAWERIPVAYGNVESVVKAYAASSGDPVPASIIAFNAGIRPAYSELAKAVESSDRIRKVAEFAKLLKPIIVLAL